MILYGIRFGFWDILWKDEKLFGLFHICRICRLGKVLEYSEIIAIFERSFDLLMEQLLR